MTVILLYFPGLYSSQNYEYILIGVSLHTTTNNNHNISVIYCVLHMCSGTKLSTLQYYLIKLNPHIMYYDNPDSKYERAKTNGG